MASGFQDAKGVLLIDYLQKGKTINSEYYCNFLDQLNEKLRKKRQTYNFSSRQCTYSQRCFNNYKIQKIKVQIAEHPSYSPDLAPQNEEAITPVDGYFAELPKSHYRDGIKLFGYHWNKCIEVKGDYIE